MKKMSGGSKLDGTLNIATKHPIDEHSQNRLLNPLKELNRALKTPTNQKIEKHYQNSSLDSLDLIEGALKEQNNIGMKRPSTVQLDSVKKRNKTEKRPPKEVRYDLYAHFPQIDKSRSVRCKNEDCGNKTSVFCIKCNVHLCFMEERNCFMDFHLIKKNNISSDCHSNA